MSLTRVFKRLLASVAIVAGATSTSATETPRVDIENCTFHEEAWHYVKRVDQVDAYLAFINTFSCAPDAADHIADARRALLSFAADGEIPSTDKVEVVASDQDANVVGRVLGSDVITQTRSFAIVYGN